MTTVSVIIPAYNQGKYLATAVRSILAQTYPHFEIIIVDDGSTDNTREVAYSFTNPRVTYIYQENRGLSGARNSGIRRAQTPYIAFLDSDDLFLPEHLATLVGILEQEPDIGFVAGQTIPMDAQGNQYAKVAKTGPPKLGDFFLIGNQLPVGSMVARTEWFDKVGLFDESLRAYEDWDMWLRLARAGCKMKGIETPVFLYRYHQAQMTREGDRMRIATFAVLDKTFQHPEKLPKRWLEMRDAAYAAAHMRAAAHAFFGYNYENANRELLDAVKLDPKLKSNNGKKMTNQFSAWAEDPRIQEPLLFMQTIYDHLPVEWSEIRQQRGQNLGQLALRLAYEAYEEGDIARARAAIRKTIQYQPQQLTNRSVLSILVRSHFTLLLPNPSKYQE